jgi:imidazolonepropionase-like amidohydrolase
MLTVDDLRLIVERAHDAGLPVTAHAHAAAAVDPGRTSEDHRHMRA